MKTVIIDYGAGNIFSIVTALGRLGCEAVVSADPGTIAAADRVIFPGVGHAAAAMGRLRAGGLVELIPKLRMPVLGICLGMQLMCAHTEEGDTTGLGVFPERAKKFGEDLLVPHMGWNNITELSSPLLTGIDSGTRMYFVHSYYVPPSPYTIASCDYGVRFSAALRRDNFYGCQFHPEKSSSQGQRILDNFLRGNL